MPVGRTTADSRIFVGRGTWIVTRGTWLVVRSSWYVVRDSPAAADPGSRPGQALGDWESEGSCRQSCGQCLPRTRSGEQEADIGAVSG